MHNLWLFTCILVNELWSCVPTNRMFHGYSQWLLSMGSKFHLVQFSPYLLWFEIPNLVSRKITEAEINLRPMILGPFLNISSYISFLFDRYHRCIEKHRNLDMVSSIVCKLVLNILPIQGYCLSSMQNNQSDSFHHSFLAYNAPESIDNNFQGDYRLFLFRFHRSKKKLNFDLWTRLRLNVKEIKYPWVL